MRRFSTLYAELDATTATGEKVELPHVRSSGKKLKPSDLSAVHFDKLVAFYRADYNMLKELYSPDALR